MSALVVEGLPTIKKKARSTQPVPQPLHDNQSPSSTPTADNGHEKADSGSSLPTQSPSSGPRRLIPVGHLALVLILMVLHGVLAGIVAWQTTPTVDEVAHLPAALSYLEKGSFRMYHHNPPLARVIPAWAARLSPTKTYYGKPWNARPTAHWNFGFQHQLVNSETPELRSNYLQAFRFARLTIVVWSCLAIALIYCWGTWLGNSWVGLLASALYAFCPNMIAFAGLMNSDVPATVMNLLASLTFAYWLDRPNLRRSALVGIAVGLALLTKFSLLWLGITFMIWLIVRWSSLRRGSFSWRLNLGQLFVQGVLALLTVNAGYLFEGTGTPIGDFTFVSKSLTRKRLPTDGVETCDNLTLNYFLRERVNRFRGTWLGKLPAPLPYHFIAGFDDQKFESEGGYTQYLFGQFSDRGWYHYYLVTLLLKLPPGSWILLIGALVIALRHLDAVRTRFPIGWLIMLIVPLLVMSLLTNINIGMRYTLPILPFFYLIAATIMLPSKGRDDHHTAATASPTHARSWRAPAVVAAGCLIWNVAELALIFPFPLSYFSSLAGGATAGRHYLIDSNVDWGQDLRRLCQHQRADLESGKLKLAYMGSVPLEFEGVSTFQIAPRGGNVLSKMPADRRLPAESELAPENVGPLPGRYAVSVNFERGLPFHMPIPLDQATALIAQDSRAMRISHLLDCPKNAYAYFQHFRGTFDPKVGYSILFYDLNKEDVNRVRSELGLPTLP